MRIIVFVTLCVLMLQVQGQTVRLATYKYGNNSRLQSLQPYADHLKKKYKYNVSVRSYESLHALINGIQKDEVDIAFINTFGYLLLEASGKHPMRAVAKLNTSPSASDGYRTAIIAGPQVTIHKLEDLKKIAPKLRLTLVNKGSTSGYLVPRMALAGAGIASPEGNFKNVLYSEIHDAAVDAVLSKMSDIAAVGFSEYLKYVNEDPANKSKMRLLWLSPEIPYGPIMFNNRLDNTVSIELLNSFTNMHRENKPAFEAMKSGWAETTEANNFIPISGNYYNKFKQVLGSEVEINQVLRQVVK